MNYQTVARLERLAMKEVLTTTPGSLERTIILPHDYPASIHRKLHTIETFVDIISKTKFSNWKIFSSLATLCSYSQYFYN